MIKENALVIIVVLALGCIVMTFLAILFSNALTEIKNLIRAQHNGKLVDTAISLLQKTFDKVIDGSECIVTSDMELFQRRMGCVEKNMMDLMSKGTQLDVLILIEEEFKSILRAFINVYMNLSDLEKESAKSAHEAVQENLEKLIGVLRVFQNLYKCSVTSDLIPLNIDTLHQFNMAHESGLEAIDKFYVVQEVVLEEESEKSVASYCGSGDR